MAFEDILTWNEVNLKINEIIYLYLDICSL